MEIEKIVESKFKEIVDSGFIESKIKSTLEKTIAELIEDCLKDWSDFGKELKAKMQEALKLDNLCISLPEYNQLVSNWVIDIVNNILVSDSKRQIEANINKFFTPLEKNEYKVSEIIDKFKESLMNDDERCYGEITVISHEGEYGYKDFYFDEIQGKNKYSCDFSFRIDAGGNLWALTFGEISADKMKSASLYGFDSFMFQLYANKVKIIDDSDSVETVYCNYEY